MVKAITRSLTQNGNSDNYFTFQIPKVNGYNRAICSTSFSGSASSNMVAYQYYPQPTYINVCTRNFGSTQFNGKIKLSVLYVKETVVSDTQA